MATAKTVKTILIVEDEQSVLTVLSDAFRDEGFKVLEAANGEQGLAAALQGSPDIILLDLVMPKMDGMTMLQKLREDTWGKNTPVILLTNLSDYDKVAKAMEQHVYDYLVKTDWKIKDVVATVKRKLGI